MAYQDGFTLADMVTYNEKHNEANGEGKPGRQHIQFQLELRCGKDPRAN